MFLVLHRLEEGRGTMMPEDQREEKYVEYNLPIDLLGPFEIGPRGTIITLRNNMGYVIIKETTEEVRGAIANMLNAAARQNSG